MKNSKTVLWLLVGCALAGLLLAGLTAREEPRLSTAASEPVETAQALPVSAQIPPFRPPEPLKTINLLLIGQDKKPEEPGNRSDSILLCTICPENRTVTMTSILRDLYVEIPGQGKNRINAAYAFGGRDLLRKTLRNTLGIRTDGTVEVNFDSFPGLVDLLGGVSMELRADEARELNRKLPGSGLREGSTILTGEQALAFARIRNLDADADVSRTLRQRRVLEGIFTQYQNASAGTLIRLLRETISLIETDLEPEELMKIAWAVMPVMQELEFVSSRIPKEGTYRDLTVNHMAVLEADLDANRQALRKILYPVPQP